MLTKIFAGLFDSHILLPGKFPLVLELEMVSSVRQCCLATVPGGGEASLDFSLSKVSQMSLILENARDSVMAHEVFGFTAGAAAPTVGGLSTSECIVVE